MSEIYPFKVRKGHFLTNKSLLISNVQKCIRRSLPDKAVRTSMVLMEYHLLTFVRRLPIIVMEDVILHPMMPRIVSIMEQVSKNEGISREDVAIMLQVIVDLCKCPQRDSLDTDLLNQYTGREQLSATADKLINSLRLRAQFGGMGWDIEMLEKYARQWTMRFDENESKWRQFLHERFPNVISVNPATIRTLQKEDILLEAVDFHCSPITNILARKTEFQHLIYRLFGRADVKDKISDIIWELRSSVNKRKVFWDPTLPTDVIERNSLENREKHLQLYQAMSQQIESVSRWYINKIKEVKK